VHERLEAGRQVPLTLVVAPAGWGKSTLVSEWLRHLIISTRADPPLALNRLRIHGDLAEIRADQLRFTAGEATNRPV
jgi:ATP/maltotriose-dependent transcriptional regulator MalT